MRVLTWNLWWQFGPWQQRQPAIVDELRALDPDIAFLQEVWARDGDDQALILGHELGRNIARTRCPDGQPQEFGNAVLSRWPIEELETRVLPGADEELETRVLPGADAKPSHRTALVVRIEAPTGSWVVIVTHLAWQSDQSVLRQKQLAVVAELANTHRNRDEEAPPVLVGGDLNAVPDSNEIRRMTGVSAPYVDGLVFTDCWAAVGEGPGHTFSRQNPHASDALWPRRRVDYLMVAWPRPKPLGNPLQAQLVGVNPRHGILGSDHYGVLVELDTGASSEETT